MLEKKSFPLLGSILAAGLAVGTVSAAPLFDMPEKAEFLASLGVTSDSSVTAGPKNMKAVQQVFDEKVDQHFLSRHAQKGLTCVTCHDPKSIKRTDWMLKVTAPAVRKTCQDCHSVQAFVFSQTDTHDKTDCVGCHMPNLPSKDRFAAAQTSTDKFEAVRRSHLYKIQVDAKATTVVSDANGTRYAKDAQGYGFNDLQWSCGRPAPADYTVCEDRGCHSSATSKLDRGLIYLNQQEIYDEVVKIQRPVKASFKRITQDLERIKKLLEVTRLSQADQTDIRLLVDKAADIIEMIEKDGSWGMHAAGYTKDRIASAESFLTKAQQMIDQGGYKAQQK